MDKKMKKDPELCVVAGLLIKNVLLNRMNRTFDKDFTVHSAFKELAKKFSEDRQKMLLATARVGSHDKHKEIFNLLPFTVGMHLRFIKLREGKKGAEVEKQRFYEHLKASQDEELEEDFENFTINCWKYPNGDVGVLVADSQDDPEYRDEEKEEEAENEVEAPTQASARERGNERGTTSSKD